MYMKVQQCVDLLAKYVNSNNVFNIMYHIQILEHEASIYIYIYIYIIYTH